MKHLIILLLIAKTQAQFCPFETFHDAAYIVVPAATMVISNELFKSIPKEKRLGGCALVGIGLIVAQNVYYDKIGEKWHLRRLSFAVSVPLTTLYLKRRAK